MTEDSSTLRTCLRDPIPEIFEAAQHLDDAVTAHLSGDHATADKLIRLADISALYEWSESLWGKGGPFSKPLLVESPEILPEEQRVPKGVCVSTKKALIARDSYTCRFCGIPLIRGATRRQIRGVYPDTLRWGGTNPTNHTAFQAMEMNFDHIIPRSKGGSREIDNLVVTCAPCNCGRGELTLEQVGLLDPRLREPDVSAWDGLERFCS